MKRITSVYIFAAAAFIIAQKKKKKSKIEENFNNDIGAHESLYGWKMWSNCFN
jgi:hypothetical protein